MPDWLKEILKQGGSALVSGALPVISGKAPILPFLNPQIAADLWAITALFAVVASLFSYNLARPTTTPASTPSITLAAIGLAGGIAALFVMIVINYGLVPGTYLRMVYVLCFVGVAFTVGWGAGRLLA
jgi:hypothetical protein